MSKYSIGDFEVGDCIIASGNRLGRVSSVHKKIGITWENGLSAEYTPKQMQAWNYRKFLEDEEATECSNLHNLTSAQELEPVFVLQDFTPDGNLSESQKLMNTAQASCQKDSPMSATMAMCEVSQCEISENSGEKSTLLQLRHHASPFQSRESEKPKTTPATVSPPSKEQLNLLDLNSSASKMCQDCSIAHFAPEGQHSIFSTSYARLPASAMMRNGFVSVQETLEAPLLESDYYWLESPGALSNGEGRPPGQTKQEAGLKNLGAIKSGQVVNPEFLESAYNLPLGWTDPQENRSALELLAKTDSYAIAAPPLETPLTGELPPLDFTASHTSTPCVENQQPVTRANAKLSGGSSMCGLAPANFLEEKMLSVNIECTQQLQIGVRVRITKTRTQNLSQWVGHIATVTGIDGETISVAAGEGREKKHLTLKKGWYELIPENFLEETKPQQEAVQKPKGRQCKGCLYRYIENKKLKNGTIASYPRVIGHRQPDNPTHWRWGFNWEEKVDGEWKGRSIGSIPVGAIPLIQSMQNEGVSLEEIIGFIRRAKSKKS